MECLTKVATELDNHGHVPVLKSKLGGADVGPRLGTHVEEEIENLVSCQCSRSRAAKEEMRTPTLPSAPGVPNLARMSG